jgi:hypothetical protein
VSAIEEAIAAFDDAVYLAARATRGERGKADGVANEAHAALLTAIASHVAGERAAEREAIAALVATGRKAMLPGCPFRWDSESKQTVLCAHETDGECLAAAIRALPKEDERG